MLSLLSMNVNSPSIERAKRQIDWVLADEPDVVVLTELKRGQVSATILALYEGAGYAVTSSPWSGDSDYATAILCRVDATQEQMSLSLVHARERAVSVLIATTTGPVRVIGVYGFATDPTGASPYSKVERKRLWLEELLAGIDDMDFRVPTILVGDINIVEPLPLPQYTAIAPFEAEIYRRIVDRGFSDLIAQQTPRVSDRVSWRGHSGLGYRFDHLFCTPSLDRGDTRCHLDHSVREDRDRLTDHSATVATFSALEPILRYEVANSIHSTEQTPTLF